MRIKYKNLIKKGSGEWTDKISKSAWTLAAVFIALSAGAGAATGYIENALTRPRKQDKKIMQIQQRNANLANQIKRSQVLLNNQRLSEDVQKNPVKSLRL